MGFGDDRSGEFALSRVAVFGDAMLDVYHIGTANRLSAEVPIPIVQDIKPIVYPGGAANVIANLEALGVEVVDCTTDGPVKNRLMVAGHQIARWDVNDKCPPWEGEMPQDLDAIVISDYNKGSVPRNVQWPRDIPIFVDTKLPPSLYPSWAAFFPNRAEYSQFQEEYDKFDNVVLKQGADGMSLLRQGEVHYHVPTKARFINSVNGAGDTVLAAYVCQWLRDKEKVKDAVDVIRHAWAAIFASDAAGLVIEKPFTATVTKNEIFRRQNDH